MSLIYIVIAIAGISELFIARQLNRTKFRIIMFYVSLAIVLTGLDPFHLVGYLLLMTLVLSGLWSYRDRNYPYAILSFVAYGFALYYVDIMVVSLCLGLVILLFVIIMTRKMTSIRRFDYLFYVLFLISIPLLEPTYYYNYESMVIIMLTYNFFRATIILRNTQMNQIENQTFFEAIVKYSPNSIVLTDANGIMLYVNDSAQKLSGYSEIELLGKKTSIFRSGETPIEVYREMWKTIKSGSIWQATIKNRKKTGETYWETLSITPLFNQEGKVEYFLGTKNDTSSEVIKMRSLEEDAHLDDLTGTLRRKYFQHLVFEYRQIHTTQNAIIMFDIDEYKHINDTYGHQSGDDILVQIGALLLQVFSQDGYVCRYGGDEFAVFTYDVEYDEIVRRVEAVLKQLNSMSFVSVKQTFNINISYGIHTWRMQETLEDAIRQADKSMYDMKRHER